MGAAVSAADREAYRRHGVVALRGLLPIDLVASLGEPVARAIEDPETTADMSAMGDALSGEPGDTASVRGRFRSGVDHWLKIPELADFALRSVLPRIVADLLGSGTLHLYEDSVLVKEPGTREPTMFHQDYPYFSVEGDAVCTTWVPLDPVTRDTGAIGYVRGSHLDDTPWRPNLFVTTDSIPGTEGVDVPDLHTDPAGADIVWIDAEPGDVVVHHARTLHGAGPNSSSTLARRAVSVRYCGDGVIYRRAAGAVAKPHHEGLVDGEPVREPAFPRATTGRGS